MYPGLKDLSKGSRVENDRILMSTDIDVKVQPDVLRIGAEDKSVQSQALCSESQIIPICEQLGP